MNELLSSGGFSIILSVIFIIIYAIVEDVFWAYLAILSALYGIHVAILQGNRRD